MMEPFVQIGIQNQQQGAGLGLTISRQYLELMGGQLSLSSTLGIGSTFRVELPVQRANPEDIPPTSQARGEVIGLEANQPVCRVLVVEDQMENQTLLMRILEGVGFKVHLAENGSEALEQFKAWRPAFIWMDWRMPAMDGVESARRIRALPDGDKVKIAAVTASAFKEEEAELTAAGFDAIVHKPFRPEQIFDCMERLLGLRFVRDAEEKATPAARSELAAAIDTLPKPLRQSLAEALIALDNDRILELIDTIGQTTPVLAATLREKAQFYDYPAILTLIEPQPSAAGEEYPT